MAAKLLILFFIGIWISLASSATLECKFEEPSLEDLIVDDDDVYKCVAVNLKVTETDKKITEIKGKHLEGKSNEDVKKVYIRDQSCPVLPTDLAEHFKNLEVLYIRSSGVKAFQKGDLNGYKKLRVLYLGHNPAEKLTKDFFEGCDTLEEVSFFNCYLKTIEIGTFDSLKNLKDLNLDFNICTSFHMQNRLEYNSLNLNILKRCQAGTRIWENIDDDYEDAFHIFDRRFNSMRYGPTTTRRAPYSQSEVKVVHYVSDKVPSFNKKGFVIGTALTFIVIFAAIFLYKKKFNVDRELQPTLLSEEC